MNNQLYILDDFIFQGQTLAPNSWSESVNYEFGFKQAIKSNSPNYQFNGVGEQKLSLKGTLIPYFGTPESNLNKLKQKAQKGTAYLLSDSNGKKIGSFLILSIEDEKTYFLPDGTAQKIDFTINLKKVK